MHTCIYAYVHAYTHTLHAPAAPLLMRYQGKLPEDDVIFALLQERFVEAAATFALCCQSPSRVPKRVLRLRRAGVLGFHGSRLKFSGSQGLNESPGAYPDPSQIQEDRTSKQVVVY